jgi:putative aldouronate transport system substrate-binding protein
MINKPWLDKLSLQVPKTTDELYNVLKAFKTIGSDVAPWTKGQFFSNLEYGAFIPLGTWDNFKLFPDGKYYYGPYEKSNELKSALKWLNKLYTEGLIDKEYLTLDNDSYTAKFKKGLVGFVYGYPSAPIWNVDSSGKTIEPKKSDWEFFPAIQGPTGIKNAYAIVPTGATTFVTKNLKDTDKAVQYFNFLYTPEGKELFNFGVKGNTYNVDASGKRSFTDLILKHAAGPVNGARNFGINPNNFPFDRMSEMSEILGPMQTYNAMKQATPFNEPSAPILIGTPDEEKKFADIMVNVNKYVNEMIPQFITGQVSIDSEFDNFVAQLKKFKIEDAITIKKSQYEKWNSRK